LAFEEDLSHEKREVVELRTAANLTDGPHVLTLVCGRGTVAIEGVRIDTDNRMVVRHEWLKVFPDTGTTTGEIDYINLTVDSRGLEPGLYSENVLFSSNGGNGIVEVSLEVKERTSGHLIDIYKYTKGDDCLLTSKTTSENPGLLRSYKNDGIVFKLFTKGTPGTTEFFGWYNFSKGNHFYSYDRNKHGRPLDGYVFEGAIGNIATIRLHDTKELYRWFNPYTKTYFYTTDLKEGVPFEKGYKYDGIAGYVR
jgi:hypothetical protein